MLVQDFLVPLGNFKDLAAKPAHYAGGGQQVIPFNAILVRVKPDSDHNGPLSKDKHLAISRQARLL
jgi:hypothetical protein